MRISLAQINSHLGDFEFNSNKILSYVKRAKERRCELVVFPESALFGYHPMDLLERKSIVSEQIKYINKIKKNIPSGILVIIGAFTENPKKTGKPFFNSAIVLKKNKIIFSAHKVLLPSYDVFDDARHIEPGDMSSNIFRYKGNKILITICEDIWAWPMGKQIRRSQYSSNPLLKLRPKDVDLILNLSASPTYSAKYQQRLYVTKKTVQHLKAPIVYVNMVGGQDELIFDGASFALNKRGQLLTQAQQFQEDLCIVDFVKEEGEKRPMKKNEIEHARQALVLGLRDFVKKSGHTKVLLGLSGGIDSALVACLAVDALGANQVSVFALPGPYSSRESLVLAKKLARNLGIKFSVINIVQEYKLLLKKLIIDKSNSNNGLVDENIQARLRGIILMAISNREQSLVLNTSNKTELACGYGTLYGDMIGAVSPIGDLLKKDVRQLARYYNQDIELIPNKIITREPTAELKKNQKDSDTLPEYALLDASVENVVEKMQAPKSSVDRFLLKTLMKSEFKRWQAPPILKVREHSFGRGRRLPVAHKAAY